MSTCPTCGQSTNPEPKHEAREPHPLTMIGRRPRGESRQPFQGYRITDTP